MNMMALMNLMNQTTNKTIYTTFLLIIFYDFHGYIK